MGAAFGVDVRKDQFKLTSATALATGNISGYGGNFESFNRSRNVASVFGELTCPSSRAGTSTARHVMTATARRRTRTRLPAPSDTLRFRQSTNNDTIPLAWRPDRDGRHADAGSFSQATWKLDSKFVLNKQLLTRATISTGFRAPSLLDLYAPVQTGVSASLDDPARCHDAGDDDTDCATQFNEFTGGRGNLKPERSTTWTLGAVFEPIKDTSFSVDYFHTNLHDAITALTPEFLLQHEGAYPNAIFRGPGDAIGSAGPIIAVDQRLTNLTAQRIAGLDFDFTTRLNSSVGRFTLGVSGTWFTKDQIVNPDGNTENQYQHDVDHDDGRHAPSQLANELSWRSPGADVRSDRALQLAVGRYRPVRQPDREQQRLPGWHPRTRSTSRMARPTSRRSGSHQVVHRHLGVKDAFNAHVAVRQRRWRRLPGRLRSDLLRPARPFLVHQRDLPLLSLIGAVRRPLGLEARSRPCAGFFTSIAAQEGAASNTGGARAPNTRSYDPRPALRVCSLFGNRADRRGRRSAGNAASDAAVKQICERQPVMGSYRTQLVCYTPGGPGDPNATGPPKTCSARWGKPRR